MSYEKSKITASFAEYLKHPEEMTFPEAFWVKRGKTKQKKLNQYRLCILKMLYTGCSTEEAISLLLSRNF